MRGISGIMHKKSKANGLAPIGRDLVKMLDSLAHRGTDSTGFTVAGEDFAEDLIVRIWTDRENSEDGVLARVSEADSSLTLRGATKPLEVRWINTGRPEGRNAKRAGLRQGDIIIGMEGKPLRMTSQHFNMHVKLNYRVGDKLPLILLRKGKRIHFDWPLTDGD